MPKYHCNEEWAVKEYKEKEVELRVLENIDEVHEVVKKPRKSLWCCGWI